MCNFKYYLRDSSKVMSKTLALQVIKGNVFTEKSSLAGANKYLTLVVGSNYNKCDIKKACELLYEKKVCNVNVLNKKHRMRRFKGKEYIRSDTKKAMIRFEDSSVIDKIFGGNQ